MSKVDAMRAMREAKHARNGAPPAPPGVARAAESGSASARASSPVRRAVKAKEEQAPDESPTEALCGHRNMGGKSCSRPVGHSEKNHRYR